MTTNRRQQIAPPAEGHLIIDPTTYTPEQHRQLNDRATQHNGWQHPDGTRWIIPVQGPTHTREQWIRQGWPPDSITIAR